MANTTEVSPKTRLEAELTRNPLRRAAWIRIAGPLCALGLGALAAAIYLRPVALVRWVQMTRLGWSGVSEQEISLNDGLMTYLVSSGYQGMQPVLLIHGLGPSAALEWRETMGPLADAHYKAVAPNLFGFASSEHRQTDYTIASQAGAVGQLIEALKIDHVNLIGHGLGADVAMYYAVEHPDRVERLMLVSGGLIGTKGAEGMRKEVIPATPEALRAQTEQSFFGMPPLPDVIYQRMMEEVAGDLATQTSMLNSVARDEGHIRSKLDAIFNTLTVIVWGARDPIVPPSDAEAIHALLPGSATAIFKTSGHNPQLEHPDEFADTVNFFLAQTEGGQ